MEATLTSASNSEIVVAEPVVQSYGGANFADQKVVVQRIPAYRSVAESGGGRITASAWDGLAGATTGIVAMFVKGTGSRHGPVRSSSPAARRVLATGAP